VVNNKWRNVNGIPFLVHHIETVKALAHVLRLDHYINLETSEETEQGLDQKKSIKYFYVWPVRLATG